MCKYFYDNFVKAYQSQDIANCKKIGKILLSEIIKQYPGNKKLHKKVLDMINKLELITFENLQDNLKTLEDIKQILFSYKIV